MGGLFLFYIGLESLNFEGFRIGGDLLSHSLSCSTIGATGLIGRVLDGIGSLPRAVTTKPKTFKVL